MPMVMHDCKQCQLPNEFSALGQVGYLRKLESMSGHVPVLFMCCEYHFLDGTIILDKFIFQESNHITIVTMMMIMMPLSLMVS